MTLELFQTSEYQVDYESAFFCAFSRLSMQIRKSLYGGFLELQVFINGHYVCSYSGLSLRILLKECKEVIGDE